MSGGQQQRLCIARALAIEPDVILMDEPCSALDPISTGRIEDLMLELKDDYSIVIVTHNMQQAARVSDRTAFFTVELDETAHRIGALVEFDADRARSSPTRTTSARRTTSPASSASGRVCQPAHPLPAGAAGARGAGARRRSTWSSTQLDRALEALEHQDVELAAIVIADDDRLDGRYLEVHQGILSLLALQAPVAGDLRVVAALLHVIKHVERMGDQCVNIAKLIPLSGHEPPVRRGDARADRADGRAARARRSSRPSRRSRCATSALAEDLVRQDERDQPRSTASSSGARSRSATTPTARVGDAR